MEYRKLGKTGLSISEISLGTWQVGGKWGSGFDDELAENILLRAIDRGVNFIDTADVYENGKSEKAVGRVVKKKASGSKPLYVASKCGRKIHPHVNQGYTVAVLRKYVEDSLSRMGLEALDLIQLHCPPKEVYSRDEIFLLFDKLKEEGKIKNLGVSVETVAEAQQAISYPNVTAIQIIFNLFRQKPAEKFFEEAALKNIGIIVRVPLASGLLSGKFNSGTNFSKQDHRYFNREGKFFDKGETFSGIDYQKGLEAVEQLKKLFPEETNLAPLALKWILAFPEVSTIIPGASSPEQVDSNLSAIQLAELEPEKITQMNQVYQNFIAEAVHHLW